MKIFASVFVVVSMLAFSQLGVSCPCNDKDAKSCAEGTCAEHSCGDAKEGSGKMDPANCAAHKGHKGHKAQKTKGATKMTAESTTPAPATQDH